MIDKDMRQSAANAEVSGFYKMLFRPGEGHVWAAADLDVLAGEAAVHFSGQCFERALEDGPSSAIYRLDLVGGELARVGPGRMFRSAADGSAAFVEADGEGGERLVVLDPAGSRIALIAVTMRIETLAWSPSGHELLILAADASADVAGAEGGYALRGEEHGAAWLPDVMSTDAADLWRRLYRWSRGLSNLTALTKPPLNVWEASWLGDHEILVVASDHHGEGSWYEASMRVVNARTGAQRIVYNPAEQVGLPVGAPDGRRWAVIEAFCSDRGIICGTVTLDEGGRRRALDLRGVEVSDIRWRTADRLLFSGLRGAQTVVGEIDVGSGELDELWASDVQTIGGWYPRAVPIGDDAALAVIESYAEAPVVARLSNGQAVVCADLAPSPVPTIPGMAQPYRWRAPDGLEIDGWLVLPDGDARNLPLLVDIHGGPVGAHRNRYAAAFRSGPVLVARGYALFLPNPRGSGGRGQDFARLVQEDMGGQDVNDYLSGIDQLVAEGVVDPARIAVTGTSYGDFMSAWLVTQTRRFAAAIPISPVANWYSQHYSSQIPAFDEFMLTGSPREAGGQYFNRSPAFFSKGASTPTLVLAGARDKNTPTGQAIELYGALAEAGVTAALAIYPEDGHSLRGYPAYLDSAARIIDWLDRHMTAGSSPK